MRSARWSGGVVVTLYVLGAPDGRVALLRLPDLDAVTRRRDRTAVLRRWGDRGGGAFQGVRLDGVTVLGSSGLCGELYEYEAAERLVEGEDVASDLLAQPPEQDTRACSDWFVPPADWLERCCAEDVGWYPTPRPLAELRDRGHLPRPLCPSDNREAYKAVVAMIPRPSPPSPRQRYDAAVDPHGAETARWTDRQWASAVFAASYDRRDPANE
jgi:hypothetical protein